jgi:hypothetical protein
MPFGSSVWGSSVWKAYFGVAIVSVAVVGYSCIEKAHVGAAIFGFLYYFSIHMH